MSKTDEEAVIICLVISTLVTLGVVLLMIGHKHFNVYTISGTGVLVFLAMFIFLAALTID